MISSRRNPLVRRLRALTTKQGREEAGLLLLEGTHLLEEAIKTSWMPLEIIATNNWIEDHFEIFKQLQEVVPLRKVTIEVLEAAITTKQPDGVASIFPINGLPQTKQNPEFILALDRLQDPGNMGMLFRTALAADVEMLWLSLGADPLSQKVLRASAGSVLHIPFLRFASSEDKALEAFAQKLEDVANKGYQVVATVLPGSSRQIKVLPYWELNWQKPTVLVLGNEGKGLHPLIKTICNHFVTLPHNSEIESLNVASVAVPMLLERRRAKMIADM